MNYKYSINIQLAKQMQYNFPMFNTSIIKIYEKAQGTLLTVELLLSFMLEKLASAAIM